MKLSPLLGSLITAALITSTAHAAIDDADASGTVDCQYTAIGTVNTEKLQFTRHDIFTIKRAEDDIYEVNHSSTSVEGTEQHTYRLPIKLQNDMWEMELNKANRNNEDSDAEDIEDGDGDDETDGEIMKIRYDQFNSVQPSISLGGSPFINMLNGTYQKDGEYMQIDGRCEFKPA